MNWKDALHYGGSAALVLLGLVGMTGMHIPGVQVDPMTCIVTGLAAFGIGAKADQALKAIAIFIAGSWLLAQPASAANLNMPTKAPAYQSTPCTVTSCTGWFVGASLSQAGGNFDIVGTGLNGIAQNGLGVGGQIGYEFWNGSVYAALLADISTDMVLNGTTTVGVPTNFKDRLTYGVTARVGYSLASVFGSATTGTATPTLPQQLLASLMTPYIDAGEVWRHGQAALRSGAGIEALVATNWTVNVDYYHYSYDQGGNAGNIAGIPISQTNDNEIRLSLNRHF